MKKAIYIAAFLLAFAAASATGTREKSKIEVVFQGEVNGDYRLFLFGSDHILVCEEKPLKIVQSGTAVDPVIIECKH